MRSLILWLMLVAVCYGQPKAVIDGPTVGATGDLVVLDGSQSVGDGHKWVMPAGLQTLGCDVATGVGQIAFASGRPGVYVFTLIVADKTAEIDYVSHTVTIGGSGPVDPPDPPDVPTPVPDLKKLEDLSYESASRLADAATAKGLADSILAVDAQIEAMCVAGQCPGLAQAQAMMVNGIENRLLARKGASRNVDWLNGWRKPSNVELAKLTAVDLPKYRSAMRAVAAGLSRVN